MTREKSLAALAMMAAIGLPTSVRLSHVNLVPPKEINEAERDRKREARKRGKMARRAIAAGWGE